MSLLIESFTADMAAKLRQSFEDAFQERLIKSLSVLLPEFDPNKLLEYAPRISVFSTEGHPLKEVYLDAGWEPSSGTYLFCYSDELTVAFSGDRVMASIG